MSNARASATPMTIGLQLTYEMNKKGCNKPFAEVIGSLMFAVVVNRPGIAFAVSLMNHYILVFNKKHWKIIKHIMRYLNGTRDFRLVLGDKESLNIIGCTECQLC